MMWLYNNACIIYHISKTNSFRSRNHCSVKPKLPYISNLYVHNVEMVMGMNPSVATGHCVAKKGSNCHNSKPIKSKVDFSINSMTVVEPSTCFTCTSISSVPSQPLYSVLRHSSTLTWAVQGSLNQLSYHHLALWLGTKHIWRKG